MQMHTHVCVPPVISAVNSLNLLLLMLARGLTKFIHGRPSQKRHWAMRVLPIDAG